MWLLNVKVNGIQNCNVRSEALQNWANSILSKSSDCGLQDFMSLELDSGQQYYGFDRHGSVMKNYRICYYYMIIAC